MYDCLWILRDNPTNVASYGRMKKYDKWTEFNEKKSLAKGTWYQLQNFSIIQL